MKKVSKALLARVAQSRGAKVIGQVVAGAAVLVESFAAHATTTLTVLPAAAATATDTIITAAADVSVILFAVGVPFVMARLGWRVFHGAASAAK